MNEIEEWEEENNTGQSCGVCPKCGSTIYQATYVDFCMCGAQDQVY